MNIAEVHRRLTVAVRSSGLEDVLYQPAGNENEGYDRDIDFDDKGKMQLFLMETPWYAEDIRDIKYRGPESGNPSIRIVFDDGTQLIFDRKHKVILNFREGNTRRTYTSKGGIEGKLKHLAHIKELGIENDEFVVIEGALVYYNGAKRDVRVPEGVIEIGKSVFFQNETIEKVVFPSSLQTIGVSAFEGCIKLKEVEFNKGLKEILESAFQYCESLKRISLPNTLEDIHNHAFEGSGIRVVKGITKRQWIARDAFYATDYYVNSKKQPE